ncbi:MAG: hypothetical protein KDH17_00580 [Rhodocyclaceae bacterium]|nr:hypothetical protein [Rhodocyclaceae bacterium]
MSFLDSPISRCEAKRTIVLTDQTQAQCALEHGCEPGTRCPLCGCFVDVSGLSDQTLREVRESEAKP